MTPNLRFAPADATLADRPLYAPDQISDARARSRRHYEALGVSEMAELYHHHAWAELDGLNVDVLYRPDSFVRAWNLRRVAARACLPRGFAFERGVTRWPQRA